VLSHSQPCDRKKSPRCTALS